MFESEFVQNTLTPILAITGTVLGLVGTVMGVINLWLRWRSQAIRVVVSFSNEPPVQNGNSLYAKTHLKVQNHSSFPVTLLAVGVVYPKGRRKRHFEFPDRAERLRIEPHDASCYHAYITSPNARSLEHDQYCIPVEHLHDAVAVFARLANGKYYYSKSCKKTFSDLLDVMIDFKAA